MGFGKFLGVVVGGALAVVAAPIVLPAAAAIGTAAAAAGTAAAAAAGTAAAGAAAAVGSTAVGAAVAGAASTAAAGVAGVATAAGAAVGSTAVGAAVTGAAATVGTTIAGATTAVVSTVGVTGVTAGIGAATTYTGLTTLEGFKNKDEAESLINTAKWEYEKTAKLLENKMNETTEKLKKLNELKMKVYSNEIRESIDIISKIIVPKEKQIDFLDQKNVNFLFNKEELQEMKTTAITAVNVLKEVASGANLMSAAAGGTLGFMTQFGIASTGRAISSLSGAAAKRAALAALGGGAKAAGGGGMALGSTVLGGVTLLPTAMIMSWNFAKGTEKALTEAKAHYSKVKKEIEKMNSVILVLDKGVDVRINELDTFITRLSGIYREKVLVQLIDVYARNKDANGNVAYKKCSVADQDRIKMAVYFVKKLKEILAVKVLDEQGNPSAESKAILTTLRKDKQLNGVVQLV